MQIKDIASKIVEMEKVPTYFNNTKTFSSITYLKQNSDKISGCTGRFSKSNQFIMT